MLAKAEENANPLRRAVTWKMPKVGVETEVSETGQGCCFLYRDVRRLECWPAFILQQCCLHAPLISTNGSYFQAQKCKKPIGMKTELIEAPWEKEGTVLTVSHGLTRTYLSQARLLRHKGNSDLSATTQCRLPGARIMDPFS
ncbi:hypothetical protein MHYP_G00322660 [Metynnis hypsauchen]